ncbi:MAG: methyl-accepting chemotaxis protein [Thermodesulfovibrionales bacterium]
MNRTWKRRNFFIKKDLQGKYMFSFFIFLVAGSIIFTLIFSLLSSNTMTIVYDNYKLQIGKTPLMLMKEILSAQWIFIVAGGFVVVILSMFLTHRFAGPIFRFEKSIEEMTKGNLNFRIYLRAKDEGKELAEKINILVDMLSSNIKEMRRLSEEVNNKLTDADNSLKENKEGKETALDIEIAGDLNRRLHEILQKYTVKDDK